MIKGRKNMDRKEREAELRTMLTTQRGKEELLALLMKHAGMEGKGNLPPFGTLLVETVLNYEYPSVPGTGTDQVESPSQTASVKTEPGDVKFDEPPGREAPGG